MLADLGRTGGRARVDLFAVLESQPGCDDTRTWRDLTKLLRTADTLEDPKWRPLHASIVGRRSPHVNATIHYLTAAEVAQALAASPHSYFFQFFKVALAFRLVERAEQARGGELYRLLFRTRTDLIFSWPLPSLSDESAASSAQLSSLEQSAVLNWTVRPSSAWLVHDWAWLAGRNAAAVLGFVGAPFTLATYVIEGGSSNSFVHTKKMAFAQPAILHALLDKMADSVADYVRYQADSGASVSNTSVKGEIAELVRNENHRNPLSDKEIVEYLLGRGIPIARRTVAKYRAELNILPSNMRKLY